MSEEEKALIKDIESSVRAYFDYDYLTVEDATILLNLIKRQQKELEQEKEKNKRYEKYIKNKDKEHEKVLEYIETEKENDYIHKDKIKELIEEIYSYGYDSAEQRERQDYAILKLKELLGV